jgi:hypothetical protein
MALSRNSDPVTSYLAGAAHESRGAGKTNREACYRALEAQPGLTSAEVAENSRLGRHEAARRLPELRDAGRVLNGPIRRCSVSGHQCITWYISAHCAQIPPIPGVQQTPQPPQAPPAAPPVEPEGEVDIFGE